MEDIQQNPIDMHTIKVILSLFQFRLVITQIGVFPL